MNDSSTPTSSKLAQRLLTTDPHTQWVLKLILLGGALYGFNTVLCWFAMERGLIDRHVGRLLLGVLPAGPLCFFVLVRSGLSRSFRDPSLVMVQTLFCLLTIAIGYVGVIRELRGGVLMIVPLVLMFGQFTLQPAQLRRLGLSAIALLTAALLVWWTWHPEDVNLSMDVTQLLYISGVTLLTSRIAQIVSRWRITLEHNRSELASALERVNDLATRDDLTGLPNRRHMLTLIEDALAKERAASTPFSLALLDLDHFKLFNDHHGHLVGDEALRHFAQVARDNLRDSDTLARWGGEEFLLLCNGSDIEQAMTGLDRFRHQLCHNPIHSEGQKLVVTYSAGIAEHKPDEPIKDLLTRVDQALYDAKAQGRNRTVRST